MSKFLLYQRRGKNFPDYIEYISAGGRESKEVKRFEINPDFRNILRIFAMLKDCEIPENKRIDLLLQWFYIEPPDLSDISSGVLLQAFADFVNPNSNNNSDNGNNFDSDNGGEQRFCYDFDAEEIFAGFISEYNIDLTETASTQYMHWYKFRILLANLSADSAFRKKIELRFMDLNGLSGLSGKMLADISAAKDAVQIPPSDGELNNLNNLSELSELEKLEYYKQLEEFENVWGKVGCN